MVQLPFEARLLFVGMWNYADDYGFLEDQPDRIKMQIFPSDDVSVWALLDILEQVGRIDRLLAEDGTRAIQILNFHKHQKIDNRAIPRLSLSKFKKRTITGPVRAAVAKKYGLSGPGSEKEVNCYYCGKPGKMNWWTKGWITILDLEFDHFQSEVSGGKTEEPNIVVACRFCNRSKGCLNNGVEFIARQIPPIYTEESEKLGKEGKGRESKVSRKGKDKGEATGFLIPEDLKPNTTEITIWLAYKREKAQAYKPTGLQYLWKTLRAIPENQRKAAIEQSMSNNWAGIFPPKGGHGGIKGERDKYATAIAEHAS